MEFGGGAGFFVAEEVDEGGGDVGGAVAFVEQLADEGVVALVFAAAEGLGEGIEEGAGALLLDLVLAGDALAADAAFGETDDVLELIDFAPGDEGDGAPGAARASRAADAVDVVLAIVREGRN